MWLLWLQWFAEALAVEVTPDRPQLLQARHTQLGVSLTVRWLPGTAARLLGRQPRIQRLVGTRVGSGLWCNQHRWWCRETTERLPRWRWEELDALAERYRSTDAQ